MTSKKYIAGVAFVLCLFIMINLALWHGTVKNIFSQRDLSRMGSTAFSKALNQDLLYTKHHTEFTDYAHAGSFESYDVLTTGDSFSNGGGGNYYQDYLMNQYGLKVLNVQTGISGLYTLDKLGWLDKISPKAVIYEIVERGIQNSLGMSLIKTGNTEEQAKALLSRRTEKPQPSTSDFLPAISFQAVGRYIYHRIYRLFHSEQLSPSVYTAKLDRNFFTNPGQENTLFFYHEDLQYLMNPLNAEMVNQNLNKIARFLKAKGIKLIFFSAADKYNLYYPYITDKKGRPENPFFRQLREVQGKEYIYVDTLTPLRQALERGEKDIYWLDDTHWSHKGIKFFCDELVKYILPELR